MAEVTVTQIDSLDEDIPERRLPEYIWASMLASIRISAVLMAGHSNYDAMVTSIYQKVMPLLDQVRSIGYTPYLFLVGPTLGIDRKSKIVNYSLARSLNKIGISTDVSVERLYEYPDGEKVVGLYAVTWTEFEKYCMFLFRNNCAIGILSNRDEFFSGNNVDVLYEAAKFRNHDLISLDINWINISQSSCPLGDIVVKTFGAYDDRERELNLIHDAKARSFLHMTEVQWKHL